MEIIAIYDQEKKSYVTPQGWTASSDNLNEWRINGELVNTPEFHESTIKCEDGPNSGQVVA